MNDQLEGRDWVFYVTLVLLCLEGYGTCSFWTALGQLEKILCYLSARSIWEANALALHWRSWMKRRRSGKKARTQRCLGKFSLNLAWTITSCRCQDPQSPLNHTHSIKGSGGLEGLQSYVLEGAHSSLAVSWESEEIGFGDLQFSPPLRWWVGKTLTEQLFAARVPVEKDRKHPLHLLYQFIC